MADQTLSSKLSDALEAYLSAVKVYKDHVATRKTTTDIESWYEQTWFLYEIVQSTHLIAEEARLELLISQKDPPAS